MFLSLEKNKQHIRKTEQGSAFIAIVAILALLGVFLTIGLRFLHVEDKVDRTLVTKNHMEFILDEIASYVHREFRLPCPANPADIAVANFGYENRTGGNDSINGCAQISGQHTGIIPFRTLHLDERLAKDGWGRYITYAISPVFADTQRTQPDALDNDIFYTCRKSDWMDGGFNENFYKARFCCPSPVAHSPASDLIVFNENGDQYNLRPDQGAAPNDNTPQRSNGSSAANSYDSINNTASTPIPASYINNENPVGFAIVLVSHGNNGHGAFLRATPLAQNTLTAGFGVNEDENANRDRIFVAQPQILSELSNNYFDDIVMWRDQFSLFNELSNATCTKPFR